jgi:hypothetical protein
MKMETRYQNLTSRATDGVVQIGALGRPANPQSRFQWRSLTQGPDGILNLDVTSLSVSIVTAMSNDAEGFFSTVHMGRNRMDKSAKQSTHTYLRELAHRSRRAHQASSQPGVQQLLLRRLRRRGLVREHG